MKKLFAIYVGGEHPGANIEVHDMRFVIAASMRETYDELRKQWWGTPESLHVDCWAELDHVDGYDVELRLEPFGGEERLYYVNLGGYEVGNFLEMHRNALVVAKSAAAAKARALRIHKGWNQLHRDDLYEAEQVYPLADAAREQRLHIHLVPSAEVRPLAFTCKYTALRKRTRRE